MTSPRDVTGMMIRIQEIILTASLKASEWLWLSQIFSSWMPIEQHQKRPWREFVFGLGNPRGSAKPPRAKAPHYGVRQGRAAKVAAISQVDSRHVFKYSCVLCTSVPSFYACFFFRVAATAKDLRTKCRSESKKTTRKLRIGATSRQPVFGEIPELNGGLFMRQNSRIFQCCGWKN